MEAASVPAALPLDSADPRPLAGAADAADFVSRLSLGLAAGLIAVLIPGEAGRLCSRELTWRALAGR